MAWREDVATRPGPAVDGSAYWARPVAGFGDPEATVYVLGLATAAHGGNRTGRAFTGNSSADWLVASLHRTGFANQPTSRHRDDGLRLTGAWLASAVRCAPPGNAPMPAERDACLGHFRDEMGALPQVRVVVCLGAFAWDVALRWAAVRPKPRFSHRGDHAVAGGPVLLGCYHPSRQNTSTRRLTAAMLDDVLCRAHELARTAPRPEAEAGRRCCR